MVKLRKRPAMRADVNYLTEGMVLAQRVMDPKTGLVLLEQGTELGAKQIDTLRRLHIINVHVFSTEAAISAIMQAKAREAAAATEERALSESDLDDMLGEANDALQDFQNEMQERDETLGAVFERLREAIEQILFDARERDRIDGRLAREAIVELIRTSQLRSDEVLSMLRVKVDGFSGLATHSINVALLALILGERMGIGGTDLDELGIAALLHDIGITRVSRETMDKKERQLPKEARIELWSHPKIGEKILQTSLHINPGVKLGVLHHHERYNGSGYPYRLGGEQICSFGQIIGIADTYERLIAGCPYREGYQPYQAMRMILGSAGVEFSREPVRALLGNLSIYPVGSLVRLNTGEIALIIRSNSKVPMRPMIQKLFASDGKRLATRTTVDLLQDKNIFIKAIVGDRFDAGSKAGA